MLGLRGHVLGKREHPGLRLRHGPRCAVGLLDRVVQRLHATEDAKAELGLHFDLTVPFARYVLENAHQLSFPFRRYQIQKVWRGERP